MVGYYEFTNIAGPTTEEKDNSLSGVLAYIVMSLLHKIHSNLV